MTLAEYSVEAEVGFKRRADGDFRAAGQGDVENLPRRAVTGRGRRGGGGLTAG